MIAKGFTPEKGIKPFAIMNMSFSACECRGFRGERGYVGGAAGGRVGLS